MFVRGNRFRPSLMLARKAEPTRVKYPSCALTRKHKPRLERLARDKRSSLLRTSVNYGRKKFYNVGPRKMPKNGRKKFWNLSSPEDAPRSSPTTTSRRSSSETVRRSRWRQSSRRKLRRRRHRWRRNRRPRRRRRTSTWCQCYQTFFFGIDAAAK
jgi:hypothetical protein